MLVLMRAIPRHSGLPAAAMLMARRLCTATADCVALPQTVTVHPRKTKVLPYLQCSLLTTFPPDPYYKTRAFICLDTESRLTSACELWPVFQEAGMNVS